MLVWRDVTIEKYMEKIAFICEEKNNYFSLKFLRLLTVEKTILIFGKFRLLKFIKIYIVYLYSYLIYTYIYMSSI